MRRALTLLAFVPLLLLSGCGGAPLDGVVIQKNYEASSTHTGLVTTCGAKGCQSGMATSTTPECFRIVVRDDAGEVQTACVDEAQWALAAEGERFTEGGSR